MTLLGRKDAEADATFSNCKFFDNTAVRLGRVAERALVGARYTRSAWSWHSAGLFPAARHVSTPA